MHSASLLVSSAHHSFTAKSKKPHHQNLPPAVTDRFRPLSDSSPCLTQHQPQQMKTHPNPTPAAKSCPLPAHVLELADIVGPIAERIGRVVPYECSALDKWEHRSEAARLATIRHLEVMRKSTLTAVKGLKLLTKQLTDVMDDPSGGHSSAVRSLAKIFRRANPQRPPVPPLGIDPRRLRI